MRTPLFALVLAAACGAPEPPSKYPEQKPGCEIHIFADRPNYNTDNIGPVSSSCDDTISDDDCLRTMKDQACKLGADTIWGVAAKPELRNGKKWFSCRAAHQK